MPPRPDMREPLFTRPFVLLALSELGYFTAAGLAIFALPLFATGPVGSDEAGAGIAFGAFSVAALVCRPFAGRESDRRGRRVLLVGGAALCAAALAAHAHVDDLGPLIALRLLMGVAEAAFFVAGFAMLADIAPPSRIGEALSYNSLALYLGLALGPPLGEFLIDRHGFDAAWYGAAVLALVSAAVAVTLPETIEHGDRRQTGALIHRPAIAPSIAFAAGLAAVFGFLAFVSLRAEDLGVAEPSSFLFIFGAVVVACRVVFARVPDRVAPVRLSAGSLATVAAGLVVAGLTDSAALLGAAAALVAVGIAFMTPAFFSTVFATAKPAERGAASGTASAFMDLGFGGGPMLLGVVAAGAGIPAAFGTGAAVAVAGLAWLAVLAGRAR